MKIKRLEISGFKSFADKVILDFQQNVTGVVGPNGCGKSNIVDAIRWCMGEQSAKNLRGKAMEDVIFVGSETRKPLGVAEVSLIFSTEDGRAPAKYLDYAEIQLTRRLYRDGESDYLINKTPCRLLDITELFMDTGVGTRAYSIIEQGKIGQILHSRPEERRFLIEEAAGVTKFKSRKQLALKKIEGTRQNLARLSDVLGEIKRQLAALQRQAKKAEKFREFRDELREIELLFTAREYCEIQNRKNSSEKELVALNERLRQLFALAAVGETQAEEARVVLLEAEKQLTTAQEEIFRVRSDFNTVSNSLEFKRKEFAALNERIDRLTLETAELEQRLEESDKQRAMLELKRETGTLDVAGMQAELEQSEATLTEHQMAEEELNRDLEGRRRELFTTLAEAAQFKSRFENAQKRIVAVKERLNRHKREAMQLRERRGELCQRADGVRKEIVTTQDEQEELKVQISAFNSQEEELKAKLPEVEKKCQSLRDELNRSSSRLHSLKELELQFAGFGQGTRTLMKDAKYRSYFSGVLADAVQAAPELETAVEAVLSERLKSLLCADESEAIAAVEFLKSNSSGKAAIALPFESRTLILPQIPDGVSLLELVNVEGVFSGLIQNLLLSVILVEDLKSAFTNARQHPELTFVTRNGDVLIGGGILIAGSPEQPGSGLIYKKREIRELESAVIGLEKDSVFLLKQRDYLREQKQVVGNSLKKAGMDLHQIELKLTGLLKDSTQSADEVVRIDERLEVQEHEFENLHEEEGGLEAEIKLATEETSQKGELSRTLEVETTRLKQLLDARREGLNLIREKVTAIRVQSATVKEQQDAGIRALAELKSRIEELKKRISDDGQEIKSGGILKDKLQFEIASSTEKLNILMKEQVESESSLTLVRGRFEAAGITLSQLEADLKQKREECDAVRGAQAELNLTFSTLAMQSEHLERGLQEKSRMAMSDALVKLKNVEFDEEKAKNKQVELQRTLDEMGEVNLMAIEECAGMEDRLNFLIEQKDDLEESLRTLQQAIQRINRTTRQRFQETYNLVNAKFQEVFPRLFCGGRAELRLTDEEDLLETGIDIIVQPPGKKLQNVTLLSGGEKALTAVALIFSIFMIKPTPFCLLDEVDAPLDDANIGRFNDMVREMSAISQFIIITHNKATMQVADNLYGITMEEPGASRVVSVRLH